MSWSQIDKELQQKLSHFIYKFPQAVAIIGCGEKVLRRYMNENLIEPIKQNDEWLFTQEIIDKANFIHKVGNPMGIDRLAAAGLYDYMKEHNCKIDIDAIRASILKY